MRVGVEDTARERLLVIKAREDELSLFAMDDGSASVLAEREGTLGGDFGIAKEVESDVAVVVRGFGVGENGRYLSVVGGTEEERNIMKSRFGKKGEGFGSDLEYLVSFEVRDGDKLVGDETVFGVVGSELEHGCVVEWFHIENNE